MKSTAKFCCFQQFSSDMLNNVAHYKQLLFSLVEHGIWAHCICRRWQERSLADAWHWRMFPSLQPIFPAHVHDFLCSLHLILWSSRKMKGCKIYCMQDTPSFTRCLMQAIKLQDTQAKRYQHPHWFVPCGHSQHLHESQKLNSYDLNGYSKIRFLSSRE